MIHQRPAEGGTKHPHHRPEAHRGGPPSGDRGVMTPPAVGSPSQAAGRDDEIGLLRTRTAQKRHGQSTNCCRGNHSTQPRLTLQADVNATNDPAYADQCSAYHSNHTFNKNEGIDPRLLCSSGLGLDLGLIEHPIHAIRPNCVQSLDTCDRQQRSIRVVVLDNHLGTTAPLNVGGGLPTHALAAAQYHDQQLQSLRANAVRRLQTHADQGHSYASPARFLKRRRPHARCSTGDPWRSLCHVKDFLTTGKLFSQEGRSSQIRCFTASKAEISPPFITIPPSRKALVGGHQQH